MVFSVHFSIADPGAGLQALQNTVAGALYARISWTEEINLPGFYREVSQPDRFMHGIIS